MIKTDLSVSQKALIESCKQLKIPYTILHKQKILIRIDLCKPLFFIHHHKAFDSEDMMRICKDKDLSYTLLKDHINLPKWKSYLDPFCEEKYKHYLEFINFSEIINDIDGKWKKPVIVKRNRGSAGSNVFLCKDIKDISYAVKEIYNQNSKSYDYIAIAQEYVPVEKEYRVIAYKGKALLVYEKDISTAKFSGNLSPLHWDGAKAVHITEAEIIIKLESFVQSIFKTLPINFVGIDVAQGKDGQLYLFEINKSPGVDIFVRDNSIEPIIDMYKYILKNVIENQEQK